MFSFQREPRSVTSSTDTGTVTVTSPTFNSSPRDRLQSEESSSSASRTPTQLQAVETPPTANAVEMTPSDIAVLDNIDPDPRARTPVRASKSGHLTADVRKEKLRQVSAVIS